MPEPRYWLTDVSRMESIYGFSIPDQISTGLVDEEAVGVVAFGNHDNIQLLVDTLNKEED